MSSLSSIPASARRLGLGDEFLPSPLEFRLCPPVPRAYGTKVYASLTEGCSPFLRPVALSRCSRAGTIQEKSEPAEYRQQRKVLDEEAYASDATGRVVALTGV
jgi:hypothetical protein